MPGGTHDADDADDADTITDDAFFYGQSPPVYPSPDMPGTDAWATSRARAVALVARMTLAEKVSLTTGVAARNGCNGNIPAVPRLNFSGLCLSDAGNGVRNTDFVSAWPAGIHVGASWNRDLARQRALGMGGEFRRKGVNVLLGPVVGPVGRTVRGGRFWEGLSVDPYLAGALVHETVSGSQAAGVVTSTKHFVGNEQETHRQPTADVADGVAAVSSNVDDRTMHELYLWPFQDAVHAGTGSVMCSYNRLNNSYGCANSKALNGLLKRELGFEGFVVSDWGAQHAGVASALAGLDMAMPDSSVWGDRLAEAVTNGTVGEGRVTDMAVRTVAAWFQMGQGPDSDFPGVGVGMPADLNAPHAAVDARNASDKATLLQGAIEGHVLLKNVDGTLPLRSPRFLSVFGYSAKAPDANAYVPGDTTAWSFGTASANASDTRLGFGLAVPDTPLGIAPNGTLFCGGGSGANAQTTVRAPLDALMERAYADDTQLFWDLDSVDPPVYSGSDACLVFANAWASESFDRPGLADAYTDTLVLNVARQCRNTVVVVHNAGPRVVDAWIDHENVTALLFAHLPGQASGPALVALLYGDANPSGKLPYTLARRASDYGSALLDPAVGRGAYQRFPQADFDEGVFIDYRRFDALGIAPRYEFGFGLSYTTFALQDLVIQKIASNATAFPTRGIVQGGPADLWDELVRVTATVHNTGTVAGAEVVQLYVTLPGASADVNDRVPLRQLRGFQKPFLNASARATVDFALTRRDLSVWDVVAQQWRLPRGNYTVSVGTSSRHLPLTGFFSMGDDF